MSTDNNAATTMEVPGVVVVTDTLVAVQLNLSKSDLYDQVLLPMIEKGDVVGYDPKKHVINIAGVPVDPVTGKKPKDIGPHVTVAQLNVEEKRRMHPSDEARTPAMDAIDGMKVVVKVSIDKLLLLLGAEVNDDAVGGCVYAALLATRETAALVNKLRVKAKMAPVSEDRRIHMSIGVITSRKGHKDFRNTHDLTNHKGVLRALVSTA